MSQHQILQFVDSNNLTEIPFSHKIKFIKYGSSQIILITELDEIFVYGYFFNYSSTNRPFYYDQFTKIDFINTYSKFIYLECRNGYTILLNQLKEIFIGSTTESFYKRDISFSKEIKFIRCNFLFFYIVTKDNVIYKINYKNDNNTLQKVIIFEKLYKTILDSISIKDLQCGDKHSVLLDVNGYIYKNGEGEVGQLGLHFNTDRLKDIFLKWNLNFKVKKIMCGAKYTIILNENNELFGTGFNNYGELGLGDNSNRNEFSKILIDNLNEEINLFNGFFYYTMIGTKNNELFITGSDYFKVFKIFSLNFVKLDSFKTDKNYIYPLLLQSNAFIVCSDYLINKHEMTDEELKKNEMGMKCFQKVNRECCDIKICF
ncbi:hypothetical protein ABK040_005532 [Willaertia magna]